MSMPERLAESHQLRRITIAARNGSFTLRDGSMWAPDHESFNIQLRVLLLGVVPQYSVRDLW